MKKYILLLTLFCPLLVLAQTENPKSLPSDSLSTTLHAEQLMAKDTLSVPLPAPVPQHYLYSPFDMYGITPFNYGYTTWELHKGFNASIGMSRSVRANTLLPEWVSVRMPLSCTPYR
mgnify:CR=1 FL=1